MNKISLINQLVIATNRISFACVIVEKIYVLHGNNYFLFFEPSVCYKRITNRSITVYKIKKLSSIALSPYKKTSRKHEIPTRRRRRRASSKAIFNLSVYTRGAAILNLARAMSRLRRRAAGSGCRSLVFSVFSRRAYIHPRFASIARAWEREREKDEGVCDFVFIRAQARVCRGEWNFQSKNSARSEWLQMCRVVVNDVRWRWMKMLRYRKTHMNYHQFPYKIIETASENPENTIAILC